MNKHITVFTTVVCVLLAVAGCNDDILSDKPLNQISSALVWEDPGLMEANLNDIYLGMGHGLNETMLSSMTDESHFIHGYGINAVVQATISPGDMQALNNGRYSYLQWNDLYWRIRQVNTFLKESAGYSGDGQAEVRRMRGEAHFLRAYFYHNLMRMFGGVPLITKVYGLDDEDTSVPRSTFEETVNFIASDADSAANILAGYKNVALGRATQGAALALKSRVLLYAARDLFNLNPSGMPETGYTGGDRMERWQRARDAAEAVMDLKTYSLFRANPAPGDSTAQNYVDLFLSNTTEETILSRHFTLTGSHPNPGMYNGVNGSHGWAGNTPIQQLVDDYRMSDGSEFDWGNPTHAAAPYENRDPRFYASILYDGASWRARETDAEAIDPYGIVQTFTRITLPDGSELPGLDTRDGPIENWNGSYSHYYLRKFIDPSVNYRATEQTVPWPFFRYAEILLNYAEASIGLGLEQDARDALNEIRHRAGMPDITATGQQLVDEYRNERRIEMAFEEQRYFDVRHWMIAPDELDEAAQGIDIRVKGDSRPERSTYYDYEYSVTEVQQRAWDDKMYFTPIPRDEMNKNNEMTQNPHYE